MTSKSVQILDCISDHEVEKNLVTEGDALRSILANRNWDRGPRLRKFATATSFEKWKPRSISDIYYMHLTAHANEKQLAFIEEFITWEDVANKLSAVVPKLNGDQRRALCLSCCYSSDATAKLIPGLRGYFTCIFYASRKRPEKPPRKSLKYYKKVDFDESIALWSMFYLKKPLAEPHDGKSIRRAINTFFKSVNINLELHFEEVPPLLKPKKRTVKQKGRKTA